MNHSNKWAWLAGIIDGDGSIKVGRTHQRGYTGYQLSVSICQRGEARIRQLHAIVGCGTVVPSDRQRAYWQWSVNGHDALNILRHVQSHLIWKTDECDIALQWPVGLGVPTVPGRRGWVSLPSWMHQARFWIYLRLRFLHRPQSNLGLDAESESPSAALGGI